MSVLDHWLNVSLVPEISDGDLEEMLDVVKPILLRDGECREIDLNIMNRRLMAFNWNPPTGRVVRVAWSNGACAICPTFHRSSVFFKPSLAEFYACIRKYVPEWKKAKYALLDETITPTLWNNIETVYSSRALLFNVEFDDNGKAM